jgi:nucleotide-binding universal stress UspA family protein
MAKFFKRILCPVDFDENSMAALDYACRLAAENQAVLCVVHAIFIPVTSPNLPLEQYPPISEGPARLELEKVAREHLRDKVDYEIVARSGKPVDVVMKTADDFDVDLIVMSTHGRTGIARLFLGSIAEAIVRESRWPVLTVRPSTSAPTS